MASIKQHCSECHFSIGGLGLICTLGSKPSNCPIHVGWDHNILAIHIHPIEREGYNLNEPVAKNGGHNGETGECPKPTK